MMLLSTMILPSLVGIGYLAGHAAATGCNQDNCYRALFPTTDATRLATAESFCSTYLAGTSTATTGFPARFTSGCGTSPSRFSSACSCAPTTTTPGPPGPTCTPTNDLVFKNGNFECTLFPWRALHADGTSAMLTPGGFNNSATSFKASQLNAVDGVGLGQATLSQLFYITPKRAYTLEFRTFWTAGNAGFIGLKLNGQPVLTVDGSDNGGPNVWNLNTYSFTATTGQCLLEFEFIFSGQGISASVDAVTLTPGT